ncbi:dual specificity phosphatase 29-like [Protopterus annectens]|uniref:dual specificity phosphatase 29-like n=1 Tax=Protopterus annectens TaxID=7888 RepID=UPI001CFC37D4|nr:dual specificity phosphatase 29-like [Protopterus annectens]XP_043912682.1 dual specificity phosphatase 29-like [Protopterus annectens]
MMLRSTIHDCEKKTAKDRNEHEIPPVTELRRMLWINGGSDNHLDEVWPNLYLGDAWAARNKQLLQSHSFTHILNAADGKYNINTGASYYRELQITYYGVEAFDSASFAINVFFYPAAKFIHEGLNAPGGKIFVHCAMGISRSAALVLAFLMIHQHMTLVDAIVTVNKKRDICPNIGFLAQLRELNIKLAKERKGKV